MTLMQKIMVRLLNREFTKLTITQQAELCNELSAKLKVAQIAERAKKRKEAKKHDTANQKQSA